MNIFTILISNIFVNNYVLARFLGICPFLGVSNKTETATGMGIAVTFVVTLSSIITYAVHKFILLPRELVYLETIVFILVIAALVQFVEMVMKKLSPGLYSALGVYLPLITTNCIVLGVALLNVQNGNSLIETIFTAIGASLGFMLSLILISAIREKFEIQEVPSVLEGFPIALITAGLMSIAFLGFNGLV